MKKVITYGTYDLLHQGHLNLLRRAKELGDWLIVGVTNDNFDRNRGKLNVVNNVLERVEAVKATGLADQIIIEDYVGQKIDDIQKYDVDIFAIGSDWQGKFDYLKDYCEVVYLPRTEGISSTMLRAKARECVKIGIVGAGRIGPRFVSELKCVSGIAPVAIFDVDCSKAQNLASSSGITLVAESLDELIGACDAVYVATPHLSHYDITLKALLARRHVLCETPMVLDRKQAEDLFDIAKEQGLVLMEANKTAHCPAFNHLISMVKSGEIGDVVDIEASLSKVWGDTTLREFDAKQAGGSLFELGSYPLLPILRLMGCNFEDIRFYSRMSDSIDIYTKGIVQYRNAVCSFKVGLGVKTEGNLIISGTKGYAYVPSPWWKTDYFELRYEDQNNNRKFFYKWDGAGLRYEIQEFVSCIFGKRYASSRLSHNQSIAMAGIMERFSNRLNFIEL